MTKILALDTSTDACSVALCVDGEIREDFRIIPRQHTQQLLPMVEQLLAESGVTVSQLDAIAFGRGPGSFAGIRIATGVTQGLAYAADLPVLPISTLDALALAAMEKQGVESVVAALDARMDEIYVASYTFPAGKLVRELEEKVCAPSELELAGERYFAVGSGWRYLEDMPSDTRLRLEVASELYYPSAAVMLKIAQDEFLLSGGVSAEQALPVYLRDEVAWKKKDQQ